MTTHDNKNQEGYDYQALRNKIRKSWGLKETSEKDVSKAEKKPDLNQDEKIADATVNTNKKVDISHKSTTSKNSTISAYSKAEKLFSKTVFPKTPVKSSKASHAAYEKKKAAPELFNKEDRTDENFHLRKKSMVRQWILYQTILGRPRSLDPWKRYENRK